MLHSFVLRKILFEYLKEVHPRVDCSGIYCTERAVRKRYDFAADALLKCAEGG
jgi:hypothetical protein